MDFGFHFGTRGAALDPEGLGAIAEACERLGLSWLGLSDHIVIPRSIASRYPYDESGRWPASDTGVCLEQVTTLGWVAARTRRLRLLTSVMVVPYRPPLLAARMLTTVDILSGGRLTVGAGVGWMEEEMRLLGAPPYAERGRVTDEYLEAMRALWTEPLPRYRGRYVAFDDVLFEPKPPQRPHPPIWIGGESRPARRRAGRLGDGWYPVMRTPRVRLDRPARYAQALEEVREAAAEAGREGERIDAALFVPTYRLGEPVLDEEGVRAPFTGPAAAIREDIAAYEEAGLAHLILGFESDSAPEAIGRVEAFAGQVMSGG